jgi:hypothetical protein
VKIDGNEKRVPLIFDDSNDTVPETIVTVKSKGLSIENLFID